MKPIIAVIDDQPTVCKEVSSLLSNQYEVHAFKCPKEGLAWLDKNVPSLILLDYYMNDMTGFEVLLLIRQNKSLSQTAVVFLTSETNERMAYEMTQRGANGYICKPINAEQLRTCLKKHISL